MTQKRWEPFITIRAVQPVVAAVEALGYDADKMLSTCGIERAILTDADGGIPHQAMMMFWQEALTTTGDDHLGIHLAEATPIDTLGVHAYAALSSPTLREAYRRACRYQRLIHQVTDLRFDEEGDDGVLRHALPGGRPIPRHPAEFLVTLWMRLGRMVVGSDWSPGLVCFAHEAPSDIAEHARVFHSTIQFMSGRTAMIVPNQVLETPNQRADPGLVRVLDDYAERLLEQMPSNATLSERVRGQLMAELQGGVPTAEDVAKRLHMSVRTLHRNLSEEGTTFRQLLSQLRHERAATYLVDSRISIAEVAFLLGFNELSSFYRAFKRWTGTTPAEFRAAALRPPS